MEPMKPDRNARDRGRRLRAIRERLHKIPSQKAFAAILGVSKKRYGNWENGYRIPEDKARKIKDITPGIDGDYIFWGDEEGLTVEALRKLKTNHPSQAS